MMCVDEYTRPSWREENKANKYLLAFTQAIETTERYAHWQPKNTSKTSTYRKFWLSEHAQRVIHLEFTQTRSITSENSETR